MFETLPLNDGLPWQGGAAFWLASHPDNAVSAEAQLIDAALTRIEEVAQSSQFLFGAKAAALAALQATALDAACDDWDGAGAVGIKPLAVHRATRFVRALPVWLPLPVFAADPDGSLALDWIESPHRMLSLSIDDSDRLAYAWLDGTDKGRGVLRFDGHAVPSRLLDDIRRIVVDGAVTVRVA